MAISTVAYPLGAPEPSGNKLTVDTALKQPGRINKRLADLMLKKYIASKVFSPSGADTSAGAIVYDQITENQLFATRDVEQRAATDEYPIIYAERGEPKVAKAEDWGGKFFVSDEARTRNIAGQLEQDVQALANTLTRKVEQRVVATLEAAITAVGSAAVVAGHNWSTAILTGTTPTPTASQPVADFTNAQLRADTEELGVEFDTWLVNPAQKAALANVYGADYQALLSSIGITLYDSNRVTPGTAYAIASGQVGFIDYEKGLTTETWREEATRRTWVQSYLVPIMGVTNPYSVKKVTGLA